MKSDEKSWIFTISQGFWEVWVSKVTTPPRCVQAYIRALNVSANQIPNEQARRCSAGLGPGGRERRQGNGAREGDVRRGVHVPEPRPRDLPGEISRFVRLRRGGKPRVVLQSF